MRIDSHQHFWRYDPKRDNWITDDMAVLKCDYLPHHFIPELLASGMDACIAVQADQSEAETQLLLEFADENPQIAGVVGWMDLLSQNVGERLQYFSQFRKLRGFRHILQSEPDDGFMMRKEFLRGVSCLAQYGFTYDILIYPKHLPIAREFVGTFPEQKFVLDHLAKPPIKTGDIDTWAHDIRTLAMHPNVWCKLSGMVTEADWKSWNHFDFEPYLDVVFEAFGTDRLMFGSDWPVCLVAGTYKEVKKIVEDYTRDLSADEQAQIFGRNAANFYGLAA
ncbi:MAG TPA: amidohydrolase family protein [Terriglobales bacterium]|nr:amidohydrolase family protein [Terriglobales bacterium]